MSSVVGWLQRLMMNCSRSDGSAGERKRGSESMEWMDAVLVENR
jgi:hypothetical protein